jgi:uncharacterized damage-inducible protein DinB
MEVYKDVLEGPARFSRELGCYIAGMEEVRAQLLKIIADITDEELSARLVPGAHQIGGLLLHLGENDWWWICAIADGQEITDEVRREIYIDDTVETDFALKGLSTQDCIGILGRIRQKAIEALQKFTDDDLDKMIPYETNGNRYESSLRWILHHVTEHEAGHRGQIAMLKRLLREAKI